MLRQFFPTVPPSLEEAAIIDGASPWGVFRRIALPLARPALATLTAFTFLRAWNDFMWPLIMTDSLELAVLNVGLSYLQQMSHTDWPLLVVYVSAQRYLVEGIALTGIKG